MSADGLADPLLAAEIDLTSGDGDPLGRWSNRRSDHRANSSRKARKIRLGHGRQAALEGNHIVAEHVSKRCV